MQAAIDIKVLQTLGMARACPLPYGEGETASTPVARGPVPRERSIFAENARNPDPPAVCCADRCDGEGQALALR